MCSALIQHFNSRFLKQQQQQQQHMLTVFRLENVNESFRPTD